MKNYTITNNAEFVAAQAELISSFTDLFLGSEVTNSANGVGHITKISGSRLTALILHIAFESGETKNFLASTLISIGFVKLADETQFDTYKSFFETDTELRRQLTEIENTAKAEAKAAAKKAEQLKKAEAKAEQMKAKLIKEFDDMTKQPRKKITVKDEFFWTLGWLAKHIGTLKAAMPDYLEKAFESHFGSDALHSVTDSKKRTVNGFQMQWALSFTASLPRVADVPATLTQYLNSTGKAIANTSFLWDLIDNYGFKFSKKQNVSEIMQHVPAEYISIFNEGFNA